MTDVARHKMLKVCFITDGGRHLGLGHVQQSTTFARELVSLAEVSFLTKSDEMVLAKISESGFEVTWHESDAAILRHLKTMNPNIVIFDKLDVAEKLARVIKQTLHTRLVIFTNLTKANRYADIAVTGHRDGSFDISSRFENVRFTDEKTKTLYFYGPKYWILRPEFYEYGRKEKARAAKAERVLLIFGGSDPANLTSASLNQLLPFKKTLKIDVVLGTHFHHNDDLQRVLQQDEGINKSVTFYRNIPNVAELMYSANLVIASPGLSAFEALRVGTPIITVAHDIQQRNAYQGIIQVLERDELWKLADLIENEKFTYPDDARILRMEIGQGIHELKEAIMGLPMRAE